MEVPGEGLVAVVHNGVTSFVHLSQGEEVHIVDVGGDDDSSTLAARSKRSDPDLFFSLQADNGFLLTLALGGVGVGEVGVESTSLKLSNHGDRTVVGFGDVPQVDLTFGLALPTFPRTRESPLEVRVNDYSLFHDQLGGLQTGIVVIGDHVAQRSVFLVFKPVALTGGFRHQVSRKTRQLGVGFAVDHVLDVVRLVQEEGAFEGWSVHQGGVYTRRIDPGPEPGVAILN